MPAARKGSARNVGQLSTPVIVSVRSVRNAGGKSVKPNDGSIND